MTIGNDRVVYVGPRLVAFVGHMRSGKDTAAAALSNVLWERVAFADPIKEMAMNLDGVWVRVPPCAREYSMREYQIRLGEFMRYQDVVSVFSLDTAKELIPDVRSLLQSLGTDCVRAVVGDDVWVRIAAGRINAALLSGRNVVVTDVRTLDELDLIRSFGGVVIGVVRRGGDGVLLPQSSHVTETVVDEILAKADFVISNDGSVRSLQRRVRETIAGLR